MKKTKIDDKTTLRAFVSPEIFPFLLEAYTENGKTEAMLLEDIKTARECYKTLVASAKPQTRHVQAVKS